MDVDGGAARMAGTVNRVGAVKEIPHGTREDVRGSSPYHKIAAPTFATLRTYIVHSSLRFNYHLQ